jgi:hypothetical protein
MTTEDFLIAGLSNLQTDSASSTKMATRETHERPHWGMLDVKVDVRCGQYRLIHRFLCMNAEVA